MSIKHLLLELRRYSPQDVASMLTTLQRCQQMFIRHMVPANDFDNVNRLQTLLYHMAKRSDGIDIDLDPELGFLEPLTPREQAVLALLSCDVSNVEMASRLAIAESTVKKHKTAIYRKLQVSTLEEAIARSRRLELLTAAESRSE